jgi:hypothetical protein
MAAPRSGTGEGETMGLPVLGQEGDTCEQCGSTLATDQRYCLNCGWRRGESRVDYERRLNGGVSPNGATAAVPVTSNPQWTPAFAILAIALLGVMLLLGVLIGKKGNGSTQTVAAQAAPTTTTAAAPTTPTTATPTAAASKGGGKGGGASTAPGQGNVVQGGSGSTAGVQAANTNASVQDQAKNGADVQATQGTPAATDNKPAGGGSGGATCIGC